jgi:EmrB/QacA subfamily drug resistance transporter
MTTIQSNLPRTSPDSPGHLDPIAIDEAGTTKQRRRVLLSMVFSLALVVSAVASLNLALPEIARDTGATQTQQQWLVDGYAVVFAGLLLPAGALGDRFGRRRMLVAGMAVFGLAYGLAAAFTDPAVLIGLRALAGVGAALTMPATLSIITTTFPPEERQRAVGAWAGVAGGGAVLGLLLSGGLLEIAEWKLVFIANAIWAGLALVFAARWAPESRDAEASAIDVLGGALSAGGLSAAVFATIEGPHRGWTSPLVLCGYAIGTLALAGFVLWERSRRQPLLDPRLFRLPGFASGTLSITLQFLAFFGFVFIGLQYLQLVLEYSPLEAALAFIPMGMAVGALSRHAAPKAARRVGGARVNTAGLGLASIGFAILATLGAASSYWHVFGGLVTLGAGMGLATTPATAAIVASLPESKQGVASAVNDAAREVGGAIGIAVLGSIITSGYRAGLDGHTNTLPPDVANQATDSLAFVVHAADRLGMQTAMWVACSIMAAGAVLTHLLHRDDQQSRCSDTSLTVAKTR